MKVIHSGRGFIAEVGCTGKGNSGTGCGATLGVARGDMRYSVGGTPRDSSVSIRCMLCGTITDLTRRQWPDRPDELAEYSGTWARGDGDAAEVASADAGSNRFAAAAQALEALGPDWEVVLRPHVQGGTIPGAFTTFYATAEAIIHDLRSRT